MVVALAVSRYLGMVIVVWALWVQGSVHLARLSRRRFLDRAIPAPGRVEQVKRSRNPEGSDEFWTYVEFIDAEGNRHEGRAAGIYAGEVSIVYDPRKPKRIEIVDEGRSPGGGRGHAGCGFSVALIVAGLILLVGPWTFELGLD